NPDDRKTREFKIQNFVDGVREADLELKLNIEDINDVTPEFTNLPHTITVSEVLGVGSNLFTITGKDGDGDGSGSPTDFNIIEFSIADGNIGDLFSLEYGSQTSWELKLKSRLDYDEGPEIYNLTIKATYTNAMSDDDGVQSEFS
ncbi:cadherin-89D, partial [Paramuricea clavata]